MKQKLTVFAAVTALALGVSSARATLYTDTTGDEFTGNPHMDITSVEVTNTATDLIFTIKLAGNPITVNWGKYCIGFDTNPATGDVSANGNGWGRIISMNPNGMDYWIGTWVDGSGGANFYNYDGGAWNNIGGAAVSTTTNSVRITLPFASLGKTFGDSIDFDIYTTGGGADPAIDSLANPAQTVSSWSTPYASSLVKTYTLALVTAVPHQVTFLCDMGVPIWEFDNAVGDGFNTNSDALFVRGSFNGWGTVSSGYQLIQIGPTLFSNRVEVIATPGDIIQYKFEGVSFPGYESPVLSGGGNRTLTLTNLNMPTQFAFFGDRALTNGTATVTFAVDMSVARRFGVFDPNVNSVALPGSFNGWSTTALPLSPGAPPNDNIYTNSLTYRYYPLGIQNVGFYKVFINNLANANRNNGWEGPIGTGGGDRSFGISSINQVVAFTYNDENPVITAAIGTQNGTDVKVSFNSFPSRGGGYPTGGVYAVESAASLSGPWTTNGVIYSTTANSSLTNTAVLPGTPQQFYRVGLIGL
ncbi:MAG: hypothetical protein QM813_07215 [Verrucomicrobiota bacterium]